MHQTRPVKSIVSIFFFTIIAINSFSQKQLLLMKGERVVLRLYPGDEIVFKLKNSKRKWVTYVNNLSDTAVVTHRDTIAFRKIDRIYFDQQAFHNRLGLNLMVAGATLFLIDQLNYTVIQGNDASLDSWVSKVSLSSVAIGLPLFLAKKKSQKINYKYKIFMAREGSVFYRPDMRNNRGGF
jgi:hypothetical protein